MRKSSRVAVLLAVMAASGVSAVAPASAQQPQEGGARPALVHANEVNDCRLNVRTGPGTDYRALTTLTCANYTTCVEAGGDEPCGPFVAGQEYTCVGPDDTQVTDDRWAAVDYRAPEEAYVAVACAAFRE